MRRRGVLALVVALAMSAGACVLERPPDQPVSGAAFEHPVYATSGPFEVGVTTLQLDDRSVEVWYPTTASATRGVEREPYFIRDFTSDTVQSLIPPEINPAFETEAHRDVRPARGRERPLVLFSHGALSYRLQSTFLTTHLASWGFVVASPDFLERGLQTFLGPPPATPKSNVQVLEETVERLAAETARPGGLLHRVVDVDTVLPVGHSAGGGASSQLVASDPEIAAWSSLASGAGGPATPGSAGLWMAGENDGIASLASIRSAYEAAPGPKRLVVISGAGHNNAFSDICEIGADGGGVIGLAIEAGLPVPDSLARLGQDGCLEPNAASETVWPVVRHFVTAHLRFQAGVSTIPWGLGADVAERFDVPVAYEQAGAGQ
jgi:dienelactone hydrolase